MGAVNARQYPGGLRFLCRYPAYRDKRTAILLNASVVLKGGQRVTLRHNPAS